jgi:23S rRNA pseudouridine2605 synthase
MDYLPPSLPVKVRPVGRLDYYTEGVLLLTNDGELHAALLSPRSSVEKTYHAKLAGQVGDDALKQLRKGVRLDDGHVTKPAQVDRIRVKERTVTERHTWIVITITEGQSRQIHRMAAAVGHEVLKLARVSFAGLTYFGLKVGECRPLTPDEVLHLKRTAGLIADDDAAVKSRRRAGSDLSNE